MSDKLESLAVSDPLPAIPTPKPLSCAINHRQFYRLAIPLPLRYQVQDTGGALGEQQSSTSSDISANGLSFISDTPLPLHRSIRIFIEDLPFLPQFSTFATISRCQPIDAREDDASFLIAVDFILNVSRKTRVQLMRSVTILHRKKQHKKIQCC